MVLIWIRDTKAAEGLRQAQVAIHHGWDGSTEAKICIRVCNERRVAAGSGQPTGVVTGLQAW
jgi:hypothetical protein